MGKHSQNTNKRDILNFIKCMNEKNYAEANKYLHAALEDKMKIRIAEGGPSIAAKKRAGKHTALNPRGTKDPIISEPKKAAKKKKEEEAKREREMNDPAAAY